MSSAKMPLVRLQTPIAGPQCGRSEFSDASDHGCADFDFRSRQFGVDALTLARVTGHSLVACRRELFMAEGDMALAFELLIAGYGAQPAQAASH